MEGGEKNLTRAISNVWRNSGREVFSLSSDEDDDGEALKWAALEKLPTFVRIRTGILSEDEGQFREIDVKKLGVIERRNLVERLVKTAEEDNEKFLLKLKERIDRVGINLPTIEVRFEHLNVDVEAYVGGRSLPTISNFFVNIFQEFLNHLQIIPSKKMPLTILHDVSGIIQPSRMTLLLGPPSSGKTTLLLALAGKLDPNLKWCCRDDSGGDSDSGRGGDNGNSDDNCSNNSDHEVAGGNNGEVVVVVKVSGIVTYNGHRMDEFVPQRTSAYTSQHDLHIGELTSASLQGHKANAVTEYVLKILGLEVCADTLVGDEMLRGISGGQKKRVTTGEMLVGPARALFMDEISTGLDSSTTFQIVNSIKQYIHILQGTCVISLLQPAPETYDLFDDIILLSDGQIVYQGPRENVLEFFEHTGFKCPNRKGVADFLQEVTSRKDQEQYWTRRHEPYGFVTAREFAEIFQSFHVGRKLEDELSILFDKAKSHPAALATNKYGLIIMAFVVMMIFLRSEMSKKTIEDGVIFMGALFFTLLTAMFNGFAELAMTIMKLPPFYKQRDLHFFPAWAFALPAWILKIPITFIEVGIWVFTTYYVIGFDPNVGRLFKMYILLLCVNQTASGLFRLIAALGRNMIVANTFGSFALLAILVLGGFILSRDDIKKWWIWGYWASPLMYGQNAIAVNEFLGDSWRHVPPNSTESLGVLVLKSRGIFPEAHWYWIGVGALVGYVFLFNALFTLALAYLSRRGDEVQRSASLKSSSSRMGSTSEANQNRERGMVLPFEPLSISFDDIKYSVDMPQEMKAQGIPEDRLELLKGVGGAFRPGVLTALMGVSGAGKTTMMDVLAGRKTGGYIEGRILVSGYPKKQETFARVAGYCEQTDVHSPHVTVYESLNYSAWLRLPHEVDSATRKGINGVSKIKDGYNPATWMLEVTSVAQEAALGVDFAQVYKNSELYRGTQQDIFNAMGSMYSAVIFVGVQNAMSVQPVVAVERTVFYREKAAGMYSALPYAFGQVVIELPYILVQSVIYGVIVYSMIGFEWTVAKFFWYLFFMYCTFLYFTYYGMMTVAVTPNHSIAAIVASTFYALWNLFSGFIIPKTRIPLWWRWYVYICPVSWTLYGLVASQFGDIQDRLDTGETVKQFVVNYFDFRHDFVGYVGIIVAGIAVLFGFIFAFSIKAFNFQNR
ncbi:hypothetical protein RHGRI_020697 [Rhododendron griersonianum]|uniref:ABC transporter domain-containing protein n=1 Tax=Rhododendron griersonianum TaxID=479676 RepID=A0AAV6JHI4_9ERIC|nr:hypothetical protein RHGRI_020697 [Rhododendron griersonianum]